MRYVLGPLLPVLLLAFAVGCASVEMFQRPRVVVPPPPGWEKLGMHPAYSVREFDDLDALGRYCQEAASSRVGPPKRAGEPYVMACVNVDGKVVALPSRKAWPNRGEIEALKPHEFAHTWGLSHGDKGRDGGRETWVFRDGAAAFPLSDQQVRMMRGMADRAHPRGLIGSSARQAAGQ